MRTSCQIKRRGSGSSSSASRRDRSSRRRHSSSCKARRHLRLQLVQQWPPRRASLLLGGRAGGLGGRTAGLEAAASSRALQELQVQLLMVLLQLVLDSSSRCQQHWQLPPTKQLHCMLCWQLVWQAGRAWAYCIRAWVCGPTYSLGRGDR